MIDKNLRIMPIKYILNSLWLIAGGILLPAIASCAQEDLVSAYPDDDKDLSQTILVSGSLGTLTQSRAEGSYQESGVINSGTFYLTYPDSALSAAAGNVVQYGLGLVNFGIYAENPEIGVAQRHSTTNSSQLKELKWGRVRRTLQGGRQVATFYLDNVSPDFGDTNQADAVVTLNDNNPFKAGLYDAENGTNDLLYATRANVVENTAPIAFTGNYALNHNMSRLRVIINVKESTTETLGLDLSKATVTLTNLYLNPEIYERRTGDLKFAEDDLQNHPLTIVDGSDESKPSWSSVVDESDDNSNITTYTSQDFVLPPQSPNPQGRPVLVVNVTDNQGNVKKFAGPVPASMARTVNNTTTYYSLSFQKGDILTLESTIDANSWELFFMPVTVEAWVNKGTFPNMGLQSGLRSAEDFYDLIKWYGEDNTEMMGRYGYQINGVWTFVFYKNFSLEYDRIKGLMPPKDVFDFNFNLNVMTKGITVNHIEEGVITSSEVLNGSQLKSLVQDEPVSQIGISPENIQLLVGAEGTLQANLNLGGGVNEGNVTWSSSDDRIATVSVVENSGTLQAIVNGIDPGKVTITAALEGGESATSEIIVFQLKGIPENFTGNEGDFLEFSVTINPEGLIEDPVNFVSSDPDVATIEKIQNPEGSTADATALITLVSEGNAVMTVNCGRSSVTFNVTCDNSYESPSPEIPGD